MDVDLTLIRHTGFFNPVEQHSTNVIVYGAGSVGSHVMYELAKLGVKSLEVIDFDTVEIHNIGNQFYRMSDVGESKVVRLKSNIKEFTNKDIHSNHLEITEDTELNIAMNSCHIMTFDNIEARRLVFNKLKGFPVDLIDVRAGGEGWELFEVRMDNPVECERFEKTLYYEGYSEDKCGEQTVCYNVLALASEVVNQFKRLNKKQQRPDRIRREMGSTIMIASKYKER